MLTIKQIEELIKINKNTKSIKYVDKHKNPIEPTQNAIVEDIEHIERFNGGPFGGYSEHDYIITIKTKNSLENKSVLKHLLNQINSKLTKVSKVLLVVYICSLFIPIPNKNTANTNLMSTLLSFYLLIVTSISMFLLLYLIVAYLYFTSEQSSKQHVKTILTVIITPIISYVIYVMFNVTTLFQLLSTLPLLALFIIQAINFALFGADIFIISIDKSVSRFNFDFTKIKRIFFKK